MPRASKKQLTSAAQPTPAVAAKPVKTAGVGKKTPTPSRTSTPKSTPAKRPLLIRDVHHMSEGVEQRTMVLLRAAEQLRGLKAKVDDMSTAVDAAKKEYDERVGKVEKDIADYELQKVQTALAKNNKIAVDAFDLKRLQELDQERKASIQQCSVTQSKTVAEEVADRVRFKEVEFEQEYVKMLAVQDTNNAERRTLEVTIAGLRFEIESQKNLSSEIAKANQQMKINKMKRDAIEQQQAKDEAFRQAQHHATMVQASLRPMPQQQHPEPISLSSLLPTVPPPQQTEPISLANLPPIAPTPVRAATPTKKSATAKRPPSEEEDETVSEESEEAGTQSKTPLKRKESLTKKKPAKKPAAKSG